MPALRLDTTGATKKGNFRTFPAQVNLSGLVINTIRHLKTRNNRACLNEQIELSNTIPTTGIRVWICTIPSH